MDPVTHAASGAVAMLVLKNRPETAWAWPIAALACASPDIDLAFIHTPLEFLEIHRGITHSFAGTPVLGLLLAILAWPLWRSATPGRWKFYQVWLFCCAMVLLHIWLDVVTTYGTMVFLPFSHYRVRLNSIFIIDVLLSIPLIWAVLRWRAKRGLLMLVLIWTFLYPAAGIACNVWHTSQSAARLAEEGRKVERLHVLPDAFSPFFWRLIFEEPGPTGLQVHEQSLNFLGKPRSDIETFAAAPPDLVARLKRVSTDGEVYFDFAVLPVMDQLRGEDRPEGFAQARDARFLMFYDLRFGSGLKFVRKLLAMRPNADIPFQLMTEMLPRNDAPEGNGEFANMAINRIRLRFSDSGRDSGWHEPVVMPKPTTLQWLMGIR